MCWRETSLSYEFPLQISQSARAAAHNYSSRVQLFAIIFEGSCSLYVSSKKKEPFANLSL